MLTSEYPRRGGPCTHRSCNVNPDGGGCRSYTDEALTPTGDDIALGQQLVAEGWWSTSHKYGHISRWREPVPSHDEIKAALIALAGDFHGARLAEVLRKHEAYKSEHRIFRDKEHQEDRVITPIQMKAFKKSGGECGR